jgi:hypothetical protein
VSGKLGRRSGGMPEFSRRRAKKSHGRPRGSISATSQAIRDAVGTLENEYDEMTVRQAFYALTVRGVVPKTEPAYRQVQRQILLMRREGVLPFSFIVDGTRWRRGVRTWDKVEDALRETAAGYRRDLWAEQDVRLEFWLEKDALADIVATATSAWRVDLLVSRGQSSETYCWNAAQFALEAWQEGDVETVVYTMFDYDRSGRDAARAIERKLKEYAGGATVSVVPLAVTEQQIAEWNLPTRPAKENTEEIAVELDAIPPDLLQGLVGRTIESHIDPLAWRLSQEYEKSERELIARITANARRQM